MDKQRAAKRPVNLDLFSIHFPVMSLASIVHRISGLGLFFLVAFLLWCVDGSLNSLQGFSEMKACIAHPISKFVLWVALSALAYHMVAGVVVVVLNLMIMIYHQKQKVLH